jgi:hypothetical protein
VEEHGNKQGQGHVNVLDKYQMEIGIWGRGGKIREMGGKSWAVQGSAGEKKERKRKKRKEEREMLPLRSVGFSGIEFV